MEGSVSYLAASLPRDLVKAKEVMGERKTVKWPVTKKRLSSSAEKTTSM
jgi:hypothetical protein